MSEGFEFVFAVINELKKLGKPYKIKASKQSLGLYYNDKTYLWGTTIMPSSYSSESFIRLEVKLLIKPLVFDKIDKILRHAPDENLGDALNINIARSFYCISENSYKYDRDKLKNGEITTRMIAQTLLDDAMKSMNEFWKNINEKYTDFFQFLTSKKEEQPVIAGLAYIALKQYDKAIECFEYSEASGKYWAICFGSWKRYYHLIALDYCKVMANNMEWKEEFVVGGIEHLNL